MQSNRQTDIRQRLDGLRDLIQQPEFLEGKGLSNEVNIRIFCYDPADEMAVRQFVNQVTTDPALPCSLIECNLYKIFLACCEEIDILDAIPEMEQADGSQYLLEQLHATIREDEFVQKIQYAPHRPGDVLLLTGVGEVFPFMRVHKLLEALQPHMADLPILVLYPGEFDQYRMRLFGRLKPNDYYRAFSAL